MIGSGRMITLFTLAVATALVAFSDTSRSAKAHVEPAEYSLSVDGQYHAPVGGTVELTLAVEHAFAPPSCDPLALPPTPGCYAVLDFQLLYDATFLQTSSGAIVKNPGAPGQCAARLTSLVSDTTWRAIAGCVHLEGAMTYTGPVWHVTFTCVASGTQTLFFDVVPGQRTFVGALQGMALPSHVHDGWRVTCSDLASLGDEDADGCPNHSEWAPDPTTGGDRDHLNPWDFYDVTDDAFIDLADTLLILSHFGHAHDEDALDPLLDRYSPDMFKPWRTAPSTDGVDIIDALASLKSFGHGCMMG